MDNIEDRILNYGLLPADEQKAVDLYVLEQTEYATMLEEVKALYALIDKSELQNRDRLQDTALAYYIAHEHLMVKGGAGEMARAYDKLQRQIEEDQEVHARYLSIKSRMEELANQSNPLARFEELSGHKIDEMPMPASRSTINEGTKKENRAKENRAKENGTKENRVKEKAVDWAPIKRRRISLTRSWAAYTTIGVLSFIAVFSFAMYENRLERMGYLEPVAKYGDATSSLRGGYSIRPHGLHTSEQREMYLAQKLQQDRFEEGVDIVLRAQHTTLNLFYSYDLDELNKAEEIFNTILQGKIIDDRLTKRVRFALGKVYLAQRRTDEARELLRDVAQYNDVWAIEASRLLEKL